MKKRILGVLLIIGLCVGTASAQFFGGIVYDPTNYANAVLRYNHLVQQPARFPANHSRMATLGSLLESVSQQRFPANHSNQGPVQVRGVRWKIGQI